MEIRAETTKDIPQIYRINEAAFGRSEEALLVDRLRARKAIIHSLVAQKDGRIVGHALFSPVLIKGDTDIITVVAGLGPVAVLPFFQRQGVGGKLIEAGTQRCRVAGYQAIIVLGHSSYYPRFGFQPAAEYRIYCAYEVPADAFMVLELQEKALDKLSGMAYYNPEFDGI
jgi:putative acetyltransferase